MSRHEAGTTAVRGAGPAVATERALARAAAARRRRLRLLGTVLIAYGLLGIVLFAGVAYAVDRPIDEAGRLTVSIEGQRGAALESLEEASRTIEQTAAGVRGMDDSLAQAKAATDRAAQLSQGVALTMYGLRDAMTIDFFGTQPLIGLAANFDQAGQQLELLGQDVAAIGLALEGNRDDVTVVAESMDRLGQSVATLTENVRGGPALEVSSDALESMRLGLYAVIAWMLALAVGCVAAGLACFLAARQRSERLDSAG